MRNWCVVLTCLGLSLLFVGAATAQIVVDDDPAAVFNPDPEAAKDPGLEEDGGIDIILEKMSTRAKVTQIMMVSFEGTPAPRSNEISLVSKENMGGVIVPRLYGPERAAEYVGALQGADLHGDDGVPMFIGTNLYNLPLQTWRTPTSKFVQLPSLLSVAATGNQDIVEDLGELMAEFLNTMGFNLHLGPSLELAPTLPGAKGTVHCLGSDPEFVSEAGATIARVLDAQGVLAVPMGFPGGGWNKSGKTPAMLLTPQPLLRNQDFAPYERAIRDGADIINVSPTLVPTIDRDARPACLSYVVMNEVLRQKLDFDGIVLAGPMDSPEVSAMMDATDAAIVALNAGADMILWNSAGLRVLKSIDEISAAVDKGEVSETRLDASVRRILRVKKAQGLLSREAVDQKEARKLEQKKTYEERAYAIEHQSITLLKNSGNILPLDPKVSPPVGITGVVGLRELRDALDKPLKGRVNRQPIGSARHSGRVDRTELDRVRLFAKELKTMIVVLTSDLRDDGHIELLRIGRSAGAKVVVVLLGYPNQLDRISPLADAILLAYCDTTSYETTIEAVANVLVGQGAVGFMPNDKSLTVTAGETETFSILAALHVPAGRLPVQVDGPFIPGTRERYDPRPAVKKAEWDFGDGKHKKGLEFDYAYTAPGEYPLTLNVTDINGQETTGTFQIVVR